MSIEKQIQNAVCVRTSEAGIASSIANVIAPVLAAKLVAAAVETENTSGGVRVVRKRIALEFYYEKTIDNPWGDFAKWNIHETTVRQRITEERESYFVEGM